MHTAANTSPQPAHRSVWVRLYRPAALLMAVSFAAVGLLFLFVPEGVIAFFNTLSVRFGLPPAESTAGFYLVLAVAYMVVVTVLAGWMFARPGNDTLPVLLIVAKAASAILSFGFFATRAPSLIYLVNGVVDGLLALGVLALYVGARRDGRWSVAR
jgi:hypothetical protein